MPESAPLTLPCSFASFDGDGSGQVDRGAQLPVRRHLWKHADGPGRGPLQGAGARAAAAPFGAAPVLLLCRSLDGSHQGSARPLPAERRGSSAAGETSSPTLFSLSPIVLPPVSVGHCSPVCCCTARRATRGTSSTHTASSGCCPSRTLGLSLDTCDGTQQG